MKNAVSNIVKIDKHYAYSILLINKKFYDYFVKRVKLAYYIE